MVSVLIPTYQHAAFIEDALRGALGQVTPFPFEIIVRDDASTDGTADIIRDIADRYPRIVRSVLESENRWAQVAPIDALLPLARGPFIAICEGDDYWVDPRKLATQVATLTANPDVVLSWHDYVFVVDDVITHRRASHKLVDYDRDALLQGPGLRLSSLCFRNEALPDDHPAFQHIRVSADRFLITRLGLHGGARFDASISPNVYRVHDGGAWSGRGSRERDALQVTETLWRGLWFLDHDHTEAATYCFSEAAGRLLRSAAAWDAAVPLSVLEPSIRESSVLDTVRLLLASWRPRSSHQGRSVRGHTRKD
jgi:glycosyltransferase involved in cell wall biosynthesis